METIDIEQQLKKAGQKIPGCYFVSLVGYDGITIAQSVIEGDLESTFFDAEIATLMNTARSVGQELKITNQQELIWLTAEFYVINYFIRNEYFLYAVLNPKKANPGFARVELKKLSVEIEKNFYR